MRIIGGKNKGKRIVAPVNLPVRPTTDLGKESLFNILNNYFYFNNITVIDLFAGTGNISLEFASRDAIAVTAIDEHQPCIDFIKKMATQLQYSNLTALKADAFQYLERLRQPVNIIFADPPYNMENIDKIPDLIFEKKLLKPDGWFILEHGKAYDFSKHPNFYQHRKYGKLNFTFFANFTEDTPETEENND